MDILNEAEENEGTDDRSEAKNRKSRVEEILYKNLDSLLQVLSGISCKINPDVERFIKKQSIEFIKKQQPVTYLVFSTKDAELIG